MSQVHVLITGGAGFIGSNLAELALEAGHQVTVVDDLSTGFADNLDGLDVSFVEGTVLDLDMLTSAMSGVDSVVHLAALGSVPRSIKDPFATHAANATGTLTVLEGARTAGVGHLLAASSSSVYGLNPALPKSEREWVRPLSPYAVSKVAQDRLAYQYHMSYGLKAIVTRGFNHCGPRQTEHFIVATLGKQIAYIEAGLQEPVLRHGDLTSKRDLTDVRDMVRAYWALLDRGEAGEVYNIGSGTTRTIQEVLDGYLALTTAKIDVQPDPARMRPSDVKILWADDAKFRAITDCWLPVTDHYACDISSAPPRFSSSARPRQ